MTAAHEISLLALEADGNAAATIRAMTRNSGIGLVGIVPDLPTLLSVVADKRPPVVLADLGPAGSDVAAIVHSILAASPQSCVVVTGAGATPALISRAVTAGARGFILRPFEADELESTIRDAYVGLTDLRRLQRGEPVAVRGQGSLIVVYSPKGGVGCTTIATNLAVALADSGKRPTAIVDLDLQFGDVGVALDLRGANSVIDLMDHEDLDAALIDDVFIRHESGVRALVAPEQLGSAESADPERIVRIIEKLREHFAYVVCDLWSSLDDLSLGMLRVADRIVLVTTPELPSLRSIRRVMAATAVFADDRTEIVLNRHPGKAGVSVADVEKNLGRAVSCTIASDGIAVTDAINQGISVFDSRARVRATRGYRRLADRILNGRRAPGASELPAVVRA